jgi:hypothetical protein
MANSSMGREPLTWLREQLEQPHPDLLREMMRDHPAADGRRGPGGLRSGVRRARRPRAFSGDEIAVANLEVAGREIEVRHGLASIAGSRHPRLRPACPVAFGPSAGNPRTLQLDEIGCVDYRDELQVGITEGHDSVGGAPSRCGRVLPRRGSRR